jgi:hypothetical protein
MNRFFKESFSTLRTFAVLVGLLVPQISSFADEQIVGTSEKIKDLLKRRATCAHDFYEFERVRYQAGTGSKDNVHDATIVYLNATLDASDTKAERLKVLEDIVAEEDQWKEFVSAQIRRGRGKTEVDQFKADISYYEAAIRLEKAKQE